MAGTVQRSMYYVLDSAGQPVPAELMEWARFMGMGPAVLEQTDLGFSFVSTVFLGTDHNFLGDGPPILWETAVFGWKLGGECERYCSREEALEGHKKMVERCMNEK